MDPTKMTGLRAAYAAIEAVAKDRRDPLRQEAEDLLDELEETRQPATLKRLTARLADSTNALPARTKALTRIGNMLRKGL